MGKRSPNDIKQTDGEAPVMLKRWGMQSTSLLPSFQGLLWPEVVEPDRVVCVGQRELFDIKLNASEWFIRNIIVWSFNCV